MQERIPYWYSPIRDEKTGRWITSHVMNQDFVAWVGQGANSDRWNEHLGESDRGVILMRKRLLDDVKLVQDGGEPKALVRDANLNQCVPLPIIGRSRFEADGRVPTKDATPEEQASQTGVRGLRLGPGQSVSADGFIFLYGQPEEVRLAYRAAMGISQEVAR